VLLRAGPDRDGALLPRPLPDAESAAAGLAALAGAGLDPGRRGELAAQLLAGQRADGSWPRARWVSDLVATGRALQALAALCSDAEPAAGPDPERLRRAVEAGLRSVDTALVPPDPFSLALWLRAWLAGGGSLRTATVGRIVGLLAELQRPDGRWRGAPTHLAPDRHSAAHVDGSHALTTATVLEALHALRTRLGTTAPDAAYSAGAPAPDAPPSAAPTWMA
jgi:hypothetical protein